MSELYVLLKMKALIAIYCLTCGFAVSETFSDHVELVKIGSVTPENYDWQSYIQGAKSTGAEMNKAYSGIKMVKPRLEQLLSELRGILKNDAEGLKQLERMNKLWQESADIEVTWIAKSYEGGSQKNAEIPKARLRTLVMRVKYLVRFKEESGLFNQ